MNIKTTEESFVMANPFGDTSYDVNPFDDGEESGVLGVNPFANNSAPPPDPGTPPGISEYNPYQVESHNQATYQPPPPPAAAATEEIDLNSDNELPLPPPKFEGRSAADDDVLPPLPSKSRTNADQSGLPPLPDYSDENAFSKIHNDDVLAARERELDRREKELMELAEKIDYRKKNWPFCLPIVYHNIRKDVRGIATSWMVRIAFIKWHMMAIVFFFNFVALFARLIIDFNGNTAKSVVLSICFGTFGFFGAFALWYFPLYTAARKGRATAYIVFWILFCIHLIFLLFCCCGIPGLGSCGIYNIIVCYGQYDVEEEDRTDSTKESHIIVGSMMLFVFFCWLFMISWTLVIYGWSIFAFLTRIGKGKSIKEDIKHNEVFENVKNKASKTTKDAANFAGKKAAEGAAEAAKREADALAGSYGFGSGGSGGGDSMRKEVDGEDVVYADV